MKPRGGSCKRKKSQCPCSDRISTLPQSIIEKILSQMPIRDALKTSILSKKWRYSWTGMPSIEFDDKLPLDSGQLEKYKFVNAIFHVLLLHKGPLLRFSLDVGEADMKTEFDQIILYLLRSNKVKSFIFNIHGIYTLPTSFFSWQGLEHLELVGCDLEPPLKFDGLSKLKTLWFCNVKVCGYILEHVFSSCPLLEQITLVGDDVELEEDLVAFTYAKLIPCVPLIKLFQFSNLYMKYLSAGGMPQKLPTSLVQLKTLYLEVCFMEQDEISCALCFIRSSPNLGEIVFQMYNKKLPVQQTSINFLDPKNYSDLKLDRLEGLNIYMFSNLFLEMEFVKLIMAKSPALKKARLVLDKNVSADEEMRILRELILLPFPRASPLAKLTVEREENSW